MEQAPLGTMTIDPPSKYESNLDEGDIFFDEIFPGDPGGGVEGVRVYWDDGMMSTDYEGADGWDLDDHQIGKYLRVFQDESVIAEYAPYQWSSVCWISSDRDGTATALKEEPKGFHPSMQIEEFSEPGEAV